MKADHMTSKNAVFVTAFSLSAAVALIGITATTATKAAAQSLNENCSVSVFNQTVQVDSDGNWALPNVPSSQGNVRARVTCVDGELTNSGETEFFSVQSNALNQVGGFIFEQSGSPLELRVLGDDPIVFNEPEGSEFLAVFAEYADGQIQAVNFDDGINYSSSNPAIASVSNAGFVQAHASGTVMITIRYDGALTLKRVRVLFGEGADSDGDGLPDEFEVNNGLDPNDPVDAFEDQDFDGLTALEEFQAGTDVNQADTDGDGIEDGEELVLGDDGFITSPLLADTDGDGVNDGLEIATNSDPTDPSSFNLADALDSIRTVPSQLDMAFNTIDSESSTQIQVIGTLIDGNEIDLTERSRGTNYNSDDLSVASFGLQSGLIFAGQSGSANITVSNSGYDATLPVSVTLFTPTPLAAVAIPGFANDLEVSGSYAYIAAGIAGLQVVDLLDPALPVVVGELDTQGIAIRLEKRGDVIFLSDREGGLLSIDVSDPQAPQLLARQRFSKPITDLVVQGDFAYALAGDHMPIVDISQPQEPFLKTAIFGLSYPNALEIANDELFLLENARSRIFDINNPLNLAVKQSSSRLGAYHLQAVGQHLLAAADGQVYIVEREPELRAIDGLVWRGIGIDVHNDLAFFGGLTAQNTPSLLALNLENIEAAQLRVNLDLSSLGSGALTTAVVADGQFVYLTEASSNDTNGSRLRRGYLESGSSQLSIVQYRALIDSLEQAPTVAVVTPAADAQVVEGQPIQVRIEAQDDIAVQSVELQVNGQSVGSRATRPYEFRVNVPAGQNLQLVAVAQDLGGNLGQSAAVDLLVLADSDGDGLSDEFEANESPTDPALADSDGDGVDDGRELARGLDPLNPDSDGDGRSDGDELLQGTDPLNPDITPPSLLLSQPEDQATGLSPELVPVFDFDETLDVTRLEDAILLLQPSLGGSPVSGRLILSIDQQSLSFVPDALLSEQTDYTLRLNGIRDLAGNANEEITLQFSTGSLAPEPSPQVVARAPAKGSDEVGTNFSLSITANTQLLDSSVTTSAVNMVYIHNQEAIAGEVYLSADQHTLIYTPNQPVALDRLISVQFSGLQTRRGNPFPIDAYGFKTAYGVDDTAPELLGLPLAADAADVPLNPALFVYFSEQISADSVAQIRLFRHGSGSSEGQRFEVAADVVDPSTTGTMWQLVPRAFLAPLTRYSLELGAISDPAGNDLANPQSLSFTTGTLEDTESPSIVSGHIYREMQIPRNADIRIAFSEPLSPGSIPAEVAEISIRSCPDAPEFNGQLFPVRPVLSPDGHSLILDRMGQLLPANCSFLMRFNASSFETYRGGYGSISVNVTRDEWFIKDRAGHVYGDTRVYTFATTDDIDSFAPQAMMPGLAEVPQPVWDTTNPALQFVFEESLMECPGAFDVQSLASVRQNGVDVPVLVHIVDRAVMPFGPIGQYGLGFPPAVEVLPELENAITGPIYSVLLLQYENPFDAGADIQIDLQGLCDAAGNVMAPRSFNFQIAADAVDDLTPPVASMSSPADQASGVDQQTNLVIDFSEPMRRLSDVQELIRVSVNGSGLAGQVLVDAGQSRVTFQPLNPWPANAQIDVFLPMNALTDLAGLAMDTDFSTQFSTAGNNIDTTPPQLVGSNPADNSIATFPENCGEVILHFDEAIDPASLSLDSIAVFQGREIIDRGGVGLASDGRTVVLTPCINRNITDLFAVVVSDRIRDLAGNAFAGQVLLFSTLSVQPAPITNVRASQLFPANAATNVAVDTRIVLTMDAPIDTSLVNPNTVLVMENEIQLPIRFELTPEQNAVVLDIGRPWAYDSLIRVEIRSTIDGRRTGMASRGFSFTTQSDPMLTVFDVIAQSLQNLPANGVYDVLFNRPLDPRTVNDDNLVLRRDGQLVSGYVRELLQQNRLLRVYPPQASSEYRLDLGVLSDDGQALSQAFFFNTAPEEQIDELAPSLIRFLPPSTAAPVGTNTGVQARFSEVLSPVVASAVELPVIPAVPHSHILFNRLDGTADISLIPHEPWPPKSQINVSFSVLEDNAGNAVQQAPVQFATTEGLDFQRPELIETFPSTRNGASINTVVELIYDEALHPDSLVGGGALRELHNTGNFLVAGDFSLSSDGRVIRFVPTESLKFDQNYEFRLSDKVSDLAGNTSRFTDSVSFTTGAELDSTPPELDFSVAHNAADVPRNAILRIHVSEAFDHRSVSTLSLQLAGQDVPFSAELSVDQITLHVGQLLQSGGHYSLSISGLSDLSGNAIPQAFLREFTVGSELLIQEPVVLTSTPADQATAVPVDTNIQVQLDMPIADWQVPVPGGLKRLDTNDFIATDTVFSADRRTVNISTADGQNLPASTDFSYCDVAALNLAELGSLVCFNFRTAP